jgi:hypothetical protein
LTGRHTRLAGSSFDYHGKPIAILKGRIVGVSLFFLYTFAGVISASRAAPRRSAHAGSSRAALDGWHPRRAGNAGCGDGLVDRLGVARLRRPETALKGGPVSSASFRRPPTNDSRSKAE